MAILGFDGFVKSENPSRLISPPLALFFFRTTASRVRTSSGRRPSFVNGGPTEDRMKRSFDRVGGNRSADKVPTKTKTTKPPLQMQQ